MKSTRSKILIIAAIALVIVCVCVACLGIFAAGGLGLFVLNKSTQSSSNVTTNTQLASETPAVEIPQEVGSTPFPKQTLAPAGADTKETLNTLQNSIVPNADLRDLAERLNNIQNIPETVPAPAKPYVVGDTLSFWASNEDTHENFQVKAVMSYATPHVYFWVEEGVSYNKTDLKRLVDTFENKIYPTDREFFGSEWTPGVDNDPHLYILYARNLGQNLAGYFASSDEVPPQAHKYSNAHEMFMMNADNVVLSDNYTYGILAHEFQHMIHWYRDRNEEGWLNEGFSELATFLNGFDNGGFDTIYASDPNLQLNDWPNDSNATTPHYGASFLYVTYFLERFGEDATKAVVANLANGLDSIDIVLKDLGKTDAVTQQQITADDLFADWTVANFLNNPNVGDGRFYYSKYTNMPQFHATETISDCPLTNEDRSVKQYGVEYLRIDCQGNYTLNFTGQTQVGVLPESAHSGKYFYWANKGDESDMTLTHSFDFSNLNGAISFNYYVWYDLEKDYDFVYLEASTDGKNWTIIKTPSSTESNLSGNSYGWGYNDVSNGWIEQTVDLSDYAGKKVLLRFEYVTDAAVNGEGFLLDDVSIAAAGYSSDFENDNGGWDAAGFVRIENSLPQTYRIELIQEGKSTTVSYVSLSDTQTASIPLNITGDVKDVVLVVSGSTRFTRQEANYSISIAP
jgi:immune inhibitor A